MSKLLDEMNTLNRLRKERDRKAAGPQPVAAGQEPPDRQAVMFGKWMGPVVTVSIAFNVLILIIGLWIWARVHNGNLAAKDVKGAALSSRNQDLSGEDLNQPKAGQNAGEDARPQSQVTRTYSVEEIEKDIAGLKEGQRALSSAVEDLKLSNRLMLDKYIRMNEQLKKATAGQ